MRTAAGIVLLLLWLCCGTGTARGEVRLLQGTILDKDGRPVAGGELFVYDSISTKRPADFISAKTGSNGRFSMRLPARKYWGVARVRHGEKFGPLLPGDLHSGDPQELDLTVADQEMTFTVLDIRELARSSEKTRSDMARLVGRIVDRKGLPVSGAYVCAWRESMTNRLPDAVSGWTDGGGEYVIFLPAGRYVVGVAVAFPPLVAEKSLVPLSIPEGEKKIAFDIQTTTMETAPASGHEAGLPGEAVPTDDE